MPGLNTSALPDLIFTVLFFFMIVTHMRDVDLLVHYDLPQGSEVQKLTHKSAVTQIYVGRQQTLNSQLSTLNSQLSTLNSQFPKDTFFIQLNNRLATIADIRDYVEEERQRMNDEDRSRMVVSLKADRDVPMSIIAEIKQALQQSFALRINYSANEASKAKKH